MNNIRVVQHRQRLDTLFGRIADFSGDEELQAYWAQFLCVLTSGFIENSVRELYSSYAQQNATTHVASYVSDQLKFFQNARSERILDLTGNFNGEWKVVLRDYIKEKRKDAIDSVVTNRHQIAHGRPVEVTYSRILDYYNSSIEVIDFIENMLEEKTTESE